ncbi:MAG: tyrosine-type recombinase/integrase [Bryobacteraceae bacterium]
MARSASTAISLTARSEQLSSSIVGHFRWHLHATFGHPVVLSLRCTGGAGGERYHPTGIGHSKPTPNMCAGWFFDSPMIEALVAAPNRTKWLGRRDHAFLLTAAQTGLRLSEMTALRQEDLSLGAGPHVRCQGKGRKERCTPLAKPTVVVLKVWICEQG